MTTYLEVNVSNASSKDELLAVLAEGMSFPDWWGKNWDACWDCMADPQLSDLPSQLRISGVAELRKTLPGDAEILSNLLADLGKQRTDISVTWE